tara:strand:+ start:310 stop:552 length:243 start_codon:yes stop_codon:yes gene_type:complete
MKNLKDYIKEIILQEVSKKKKKKQSNKSPSWIKKGENAIYKNKKVKIVEPDIRGPLALIKVDSEEKAVNYKELRKPNAKS